MAEVDMKKFIIGLIISFFGIVIWWLGKDFIFTMIGIVIFILGISVMTKYQNWKK